MRIKKKLYAPVLALVLLSTCAKNNTSQKNGEEVPPPPPAEAEAPPPPETPPVTGPIAGSVLDVVSANSPLPQDVLAAMAGYGATVQGQVQYWHTRSLDINGDGAKELLISNVLEWCGSGGCSVWLWQRTRSGLRNLLPSEDLTAAALLVENESTQGYRALSIYHRAQGRDKELLMVSDRYVWGGEAYSKSSSSTLGKYLETPLPPEAWKVIP